MKKYLLVISLFIAFSHFAFAQPSNDDCSNAESIAITSNGFDIGLFTSSLVDITDATFQINENFHNVQVAAGNDKKTIWFSFTLPTARAVNLELLQPTENIAQNGAGFTVYKTNTCLPELDAITDAKLTPVNKFGSTYNPCLLPGEYLIQVSAQDDSDGEVYLELTIDDPQVTSDYANQVNAYDFGNVSGGWHTVNFDAGCQTIQDENEVCPELGSDYLEYTQSAWFVFTTDNAVDLITLRMGEQSGFFTGDFRVAYNIYQGDVRSTDYSGLTLIDGCRVMEQTVASIIPSRNYLCDFQPNTTYSIQVFFHDDYMNSVYLQMFERGSGDAFSPNPSAMDASSQLGVLPASASGEWTYAYDQFGCNAFIADNACGLVNPAAGTVSIGSNNYELSVWYTFQIDDYMNVRFVTNGYLGKKLFQADVSTDCNIAVYEEFTSGDYTINCLEPGVYSMQILGKVDTSQNYVNSNYNHIGFDADLGLFVVNNSISSDFLLDATGKIDTVNKVSGVWEPLPEDIQISASLGRLNCQSTVLPDGGACNASNDRAMYREIIIGDSDGDGNDDSGVLTLSGGNYYLNYLFYQGNASDLATAQSSFSPGETISGLTAITSCMNLYYSNKICVEPGTYTLVSFGDGTDVGRTDDPDFRFKQYNTLFDDPNAPDDLGDITVALNSGTVTGTVDYFSCEDNPLTIAGKDPCSNATKQIYRQFYIGEDRILNFSQSGGNSFRLFYGKITDGLSSLTATIPGVGDIGCRSSYHTDVCNPLPSGWYTIVVYGVGGSYSGPDYDGGVIGNQTNVSISKVEPLDPTLYHAPYLAYDAGVCDWGPNAGTPEIPLTSQTYTFATERFNCLDNEPLLVTDCAGFNREAFYVFEITQESYLSFTGIPASMKAQIFAADVRTDSTLFPSLTPIQECINISNIGSYDRWWWTWYGKIDMCKVQPGVYTLIVNANDSHINQTVTPVLYVDQVESSRFDFAYSAYDFDLIPADNAYHYGKTADVNPINPLRAPSNDFYSCTTGAFPNDPGQSDATSYCWDGMYPVDGQPSVDYPMSDDFTQYSGSTNRPVRRNLWYTFVVDGPGLISVKVENKTTGKTSQNPFAIYKSDVDGTLDFNTIQLSGEVDSTLAQGLTFIKNNSTFGYYGCAGNQETISFNIDPCDNPGKQRFYVVVDQHVGIIPNSQIEVSIKHDPVASVESKYDYFIESNLINGLNEVNPPYTPQALSDGTYSGDMSSYACASMAATDQNSCGSRTLWYKFESAVSGTLRIQYEIDGGGTHYNANDIMLFREIIPGDSTVMGLEKVSPSSVSVSGVAWGESCLNVGTYYIMLTGCSYTVENVTPRIQLISEYGDNCEQSVPIVMNAIGVETATVSVDCHDIGASFGEDGTNMGCLLGPEGYKSTWFRVDLNFTEKADVTYQLTENTTALPSQIRYRVLYGSCNAMTAGPCNTDALTEFTLNCMLSETSSYFVQVVMPENTTGDITLSVTATESPNQTCLPFDPLVPTANFIYENTCEGDITCFTNQSSLGASIQYEWIFDVNDPSSDTSTDTDPCYEFPSDGTYITRLIVTNLDEGTADTVDVNVVIYPKPDPDISRTPSDYEVISGVSVDFYSNVTETISDPPTSYAWDLANGTSSQSDPSGIVYDDQNLGFNLISLEVINGTCVITDTDSIMVGYEPIYEGGINDGAALSFLEGSCELEDIFEGGENDGNAFAYIDGNCPPEDIFTGGINDGAALTAIEGNCPPENIFVGGINDGAAFFRIEGSCPLEDIFVGGFYDGGSKFQNSGEIEYSLSDDVICSSDNITISVTEISPLDSVEWYNGETLITTIYSSPFDLVVSLTESANITAVACFQNACEDASNSFDIAVIHPIVADAGSDLAICTGEEIQIGTDLVEINPTINWSPSSSLNDATLEQPFASPTVTTEYCVTVTDSENVCSTSTDCVMVSVDSDIPAISVEDMMICQSGSVDLTLTGTVSGDNISWFSGVYSGSVLTALMPALPDENITASSYWGANHESYRARLNASYDPNWTAGTQNTSQWIKVDLGEEKLIGAIATQGRFGADQWVTSYKVSYSSNDVDWTFIQEGASDKIFTANSDRNTVVQHDFDNAMMARYVRIHPQSWQSYISMRMEVYEKTILNTTDVLNTSDPGWYSVLVERGECSALDSAQVFLIEDPAGEDTGICDPSEMVQIGTAAQDGFTYAWSPATDLSNSSISDPISTPSSDIIYTLTVTHSSGDCVDQVSVFAPVSVDAGSDLDICPSSSVVLNATGSASLSLWQWTTESLGYNLPVEINNTSASDLVDYQVRILLNTEDLINQSKMNLDCSDLRVKADDLITDLPFWIVDGTCDSTETELWVRVNIPAGSSETIYLFYSNLPSVNMSNGDAVFEFFDDFNSSAIDVSKWTQGLLSPTSGDDWSMSSGYLYGGNTNRFLQSNLNFTGNYIAETRIYTTNSCVNGFTTNGFWGSTSNQMSILSHESSSYIYYRDDGTWVPSSLPLTGYWARDEVIANGTDGNTRRFNETTGTYVWDRTFINSGLSAEALRIGSRGDNGIYNQNFDAQWDWIFVRKYADVEPGYSIGTESINAFATTQSTSVSESGTYIVMGTNGVCADTDTVEVVDVGADAMVMAWRTKASGNWDNTSVWEVYDAGSWVNADTWVDACGNGLTYPDYNDSTILIRSTHSIQCNLSIAVDECSIENGGSVQILSGSLFTVVDSSSSPIAEDLIVDGILSIDSGAELTNLGASMVQNNGRIEVSGVLSLEGGLSPALFNDHNSTVAYVNGDQDLWNGTYGRLETNGGGLKTVVGTLVRVTNEVEFILGKIILGNRNLTLTESANTLNASFATGYFITNSNGSLIKENLGASGTENFLLPVGHSELSYNPAYITNSGVADNFRIRLIGDFEYEDAYPNDELTEISSVDRAWYISEDVQGGSDIELKLLWENSHENVDFDPTACQIGWFDISSGWLRIGSVSPATGGGVYGDLFSQSAVGIIDLGYFTLGSCAIMPDMYRTIADGDWTDINIWEVYDGTQWISPLFFPTACGEITYPTSNSNEIFVRHNVVYDFSIPQGIDQTTIESTAYLTVPDGVNLHIANGSGSDVLNQAYIKILGTIDAEAGFSLLNQPGSVVHYADGNQDMLACEYADLIVEGTQPNAYHIKSVGFGNSIVSENLYFNNARIRVENGNMTIAESALIHDYSDLNGYFVCLYDAYLIVEYPLGANVSKEFPVGGTDYSPASIDFDQVTVAGAMACRLREQVHPNNPNSIQRYWNFEQQSINFSGSYNMTVHYLEEDLPYIPSNSLDELNMLQMGGAYNTSYATTDNWIYMDQASNYFVDVDNDYAVLTHNQFSDFTLLSKNNPLPVSLIRIDASWVDDDALIQWVTASEFNNAGFDVERSIGDLDGFVKIGFVQGAGSSNQYLSYQFVDEKLKLRNGEDFYFRLKQIDFDGTESYSPIVHLRNSIDDANTNDRKLVLACYPNPVSRGEELHVVVDSEVTANAEFLLYNSLGEMLGVEYVVLLEGESHHVINLTDYPEGAYVLKLKTEKHTEFYKLIISRR